MALDKFISIPALQIIGILFLFICNTEKFCGIALMPLATLVKCHDCGRVGSAFFSASFPEKSKLKLVY